MLSLTRKADYALVALVTLAYRRRQGEGPMSARQIAGTFGMPRALLMNTLKALARRGLVRSHRGVAGGYELAVDAADVSLLDVVRAVEGGEDEVGGDEASEGEGGRAESAVVCRLEDRLFGYLGGLTLADLLDEQTDEPTHTAPPAQNRASGQSVGPIPLRTEARA